MHPPAIVEQNDRLESAQQGRIQVRVKGGHIARDNASPACRTDGIPVKMTARPFQPKTALENDGNATLVSDPDLQVLVRQPSPTAFRGKDIRHGGIGYDGHFKHSLYSRCIIFTSIELEFIQKG